MPAGDRWRRRRFVTVTSFCVVHWQTPSGSAWSAATRPLQLWPLPHREPSSGLWSSEEIQRFFVALAGERLSMAFVMLATTGMRRGEVLGLRWEDVDFAGRALSIVQTLTTVRGERHIGPPKTGKSRRRVSIDAVTLDALKAHRKRQRVERIAAADVWSNEGDLVFTDELGEPVHQNRLS